MALLPQTFQDNPQTPSILAELYNPDQLLMGGPYRTEGQATISGAAVLLRGTVMGQAAVGSPVVVLGKAFATGTITVAQVPTGGSVSGGGGGAPVGGDTATINGTVVTFVVTPTGLPSEVPVGNEIVLPAGLVAGSTATADLASVANAIASFINGSTDVNISKLTATVSAAVVTINSKIPGTGGNAYTLAVSNATSLTVSGATLSGGTNNAGSGTFASVTFGPQAIPGVYTFLWPTATTTVVMNPLGDVVADQDTGAMGAFTSPEINFTTGGTPTAADGGIITPAAVVAGGVWKKCVASAVDGSDTPMGILLDTADPTSGNVNSGVLLMGAVNGNALILDPTLNLVAVKQSLRPFGIHVKTGVISAAPPQ
jgi:hypothetical protein